MKNENTLYDAPVQESLETTLLGGKDTVVAEGFDALVSQAKVCLEEQDYQKAAECLEKARRLDVVRENELMEDLAVAYCGCNDEIRSLYWFECASEEFGRERYEDIIMKLYQTGVAGTALKTEAEEHFAAIAKAEEIRRKEERKAWLIKNIGKEKEILPESLVKKMKELIEFEDMYIRQAYERDARMKRTNYYNSKNRRWEERVEEQNQIIKEDELLTERYHVLLDECKKEKERCQVQQTCFFEMPLSRWDAYDQLKALGEKSVKYYKGHSLYDRFKSFDAKQYYTDDQGYNMRDYDLKAQSSHVHVAETYMAGEVDFFFVDQHNRVIPREQKKTDVTNAGLYTTWGYRNALLGDLDFLMPYLVDGERFVTLYCDWDYLKEHAAEEDKYELNYLWDTDLLLVYQYDDCIGHQESLKNYYDASPNLMEMYLPIGEGRTFENMSEYVIGWGYDFNWHMDLSNGEKYDMRYLKKAVILKRDGKIRAIVLPKSTGQIIKVHAWREYITGENGQTKRFDKVQSIRREQGPSWEYFVATTMDYVASKLGDQLKPLDITEEKPEGMPDNLWRYWIKCRYNYEKKNKK